MIEQGIFILVVVLVGGFAGVRVFGGTARVAFVASTLCVTITLIAALLLLPDRPVGFLLTAACAILVGVVLRLDPAQIGGLAIGSVASAFIGAASLHFLPDLSSRGSQFIYSDCSLFKGEIVSLSESSKTQNSGVYILAIGDEEKISTSSGETKCTASALFSNGIKSKIEYRSFKDFDQWFLEYRQIL